MFIYHTNDNERSAKPASRIKLMAENFLKGIQVTLHEPDANEDGKSPNHVFKAIDTWFSSVQPERLIINATGGLKTMFAGALQFIYTAQVIVVYRDLDGAWLEITECSGTFQSKPIDVNHTILDQRLKKMGIKELVQIQSGFPMFKSSQPIEIDCVDGLNKAILNKWDWRCLSTTNTKGIAFEHWFASLIATFEPDDLLIGLEPINKGQALMETDVWALKNSQLYMFDLKLITNNEKKSSLAEQITNASAQGEQFAGRNVKIILVRPGFSFPQAKRESFKKLASKFACQIWFQEDMEQLLIHLDKMFGQPSVLHKELTRLVNIGKLRNGCLFSNPDSKVSYIRSKKSKTQISFDTLFNTVTDENARWLGIYLGNHNLYRIHNNDMDKLINWARELRKHNCQVNIIGKTGLYIYTETQEARGYLNQQRANKNTESLFSF